MPAIPPGPPGQRLRALRADGEFVLYRGTLDDSPDPVLVVAPAADQPPAGSLERLVHEYALRDALAPAWAAVPRALLQRHGRRLLVLADPGGEPLDRLLRDRPLDIATFLRLAGGLAAALGHLHRRGLVHKDIKPANFLVDLTGGAAWLTGFGCASRLPREHQPPAPPEAVAGTLAYMAPEQTGRMNRSVDARSDLYALGVTFYEMLIGALPFAAADPLDWVHCHMARPPPPPAERRTDVPAPVSAIVLKLLAKAAEDRYQTAAGLAADLRRCQGDWEATSRIAPFPLGEQDIPDVLRIPEKLYGREREVAGLLAAFDRVAAGGTPELLLVAGVPGVGKSAVVNELHKALVRSHGLFAAGKFDQHKRDIPYATVAQAFQGLIRPLLGKSEAELGRWRDDLRAVLEPNGALMVQLIPELELILGPQPPVPDLPPQDAQHRVQRLFRHFLGVFARPEHPLALVLDDLQWLDAATLDLLEELLTHRSVRHVLLIGAYRDDEVDAEHPLRHALDAISRAGVPVQEIALAPLAPDTLERLVADALRCEPTHAAALAAVVREKTGGNPFFAIQFLTVLWEEGLLFFDAGAGGWRWTLPGIDAKGYTDNVVDLMLGKLGRLPREARDALTRLAALGDAADAATLGPVLGRSAEALHGVLREAVRAGLVLRKDSGYSFVHDRVREAAYSLIPAHERPTVHRQIGRLLADRTPPERREAMAFEIVNQLNRGRALITAPEDRDQAAELNLVAGQRAKAATAYAAARTYFAAGAALLAEDRWERQHRLSFTLELRCAECEFLTGALAEAEERLSALAHRAADLPDLAAVTRLQTDLFMTVGRCDRAVATVLEYLRRVGVAWSAHPTPDEVRHEYARLWDQLAGRPIEALLDLPRMDDPIACGTMDVLAEAVGATWLTDENLRSLVIGRMANLSLEHGNCDASCFAYALLGTKLGPYFGDYEAGFRFGQLAIELVEKRSLGRFKARVCLVVGSFVNPWTEPLPTCRALVRRAFDAAQGTGDITCAALSGLHLATNVLASGDPLAEVQRETEAGLDVARRARFGLVVDGLTVHLQFVRMLRGLTPTFGSFDDADFDEDRFRRHLQDDPRLVTILWMYWIKALQAHVFAGDPAAAKAAAAQAERFLFSMASFLEAAEYHFYAALAESDRGGAASDAERAGALAALAAHHQRLQRLADQCPENFADRAALVGAELARVEGRDLDAMRLYERAIRAARESGAACNEALAHERASQFFLDRGLETAGLAHLRAARQGYALWGAEGKVRQLNSLQPQRLPPDTAPALVPDRAVVQQLDVTAVVKAAQAVAGEIELPGLVETLMRNALQHAGAERGLLLLPQDGGVAVEAEAWTGDSAIEVRLRPSAGTAMGYSEAVVNTAIRTRRSVILDDTAHPDGTGEAGAPHHAGARSVFCLPLLRQARLAGVLYLENSRASHAFTTDRVAVLEVLAGPAAIALENARLYADLREREARVRRLVEANIVGIFLWDVEGRIIEANDAFLAIVGYRRDDLVRDRVGWRDLTPPEWLDQDERRWLPELRVTGRLPPFEKEFFRKDGGRVPVLIGVATFEPARAEGVAFVLDLSERKQREEELRAAKAEAERASLSKSKFLAAAAHDLRQPLQSLFLFAHALHSDVAGEPGQKKLAMVERGLETLKGLLDSLLDVSSLDVKVLQPQITDVPLAPLLEEIVAFYAPRAAVKGLTLRVVADDRLRVRSDATLLGRMVRNLVENAIRYTDRGGVELRGQAMAGTVRIEVCDSGIGIPGDQMGLIFEDFHQVGNPERDRTKGLGLGLSIVHRLSRLLEHPVEVHSTFGRGSVFTIRVPAGAPAEGGPAAAREPREQTAGSAGRFAVLVDDDAIVLLGLRVMFGEWGYETLAAGSTEQALERLRTTKRAPDLVVADYRLRAGRVGTETILAVRALVGRPVPGILLTGEVGDACERDAERHGFGLIHKPVTPRQLHSELERCLARGAA